jgi:hypothetical protein
MINPQLKDAFERMKEVLKQLTPEEREQLKRLTKRANECIKNDDLIGLQKLKNGTIGNK